MRKIVVSEFISLDGVIQGPGFGDVFEYAGWTMPYFNDEIGGYIGASMANSDTLLLGRVTYDTFSSTFASQTEGPAAGLNSVKKYVVSTTLKSADWNNSTLISANVAEEVAKLKQQAGKDISVTGSATLVQTLTQHNLVDEYALLVYPIVLGLGARLFPEGTGKLNLKLVEAKPFSNGVTLMRYVPEASNS